MLEAEFNAEDGFWRAGIGCILPRKYRSTVCVTFTCESISKEPQIKAREIMFEV